MNPKPFVKWPGGKGQLLPQLLSLIPKNFNRYHEQFVGGGALFFALQPDRATLSDLNSRLMNAYHWIQADPESVIESLAQMKTQHCPEFYYATRTNLNNYYLESAFDAARFIYLNKTGYNGLYRENSNGEINVPIGRYVNPSIYDEEAIFAASKALKRVRSVAQPFSRSRPSPGDLAYFDPPYDRVNGTSFTAYNKAGFSREDQARLARRVKVLADRGVQCMVSNSDTQFIRDLYSDFTIHEVLARRNCNSNGADRGPVKELIICTY